VRTFHLRFLPSPCCIRLVWIKSVPSRTACAHGPLHFTVLCSGARACYTHRLPLRCGIPSDFHTHSSRDTRYPLGLLRHAVYLTPRVRAYRGLTISIPSSSPPVPRRWFVLDGPARACILCSLRCPEHCRALAPFWPFASGFLVCLVPFCSGARHSSTRWCFVTGCDTRRRVARLRLQHHAFDAGVCSGIHCFSNTYGLGILYAGFPRVPATLPLLSNAFSLGWPTANGTTGWIVHSAGSDVAFDIPTSSPQLLPHPLPKPSSALMDKHLSSIFCLQNSTMPPFPLRYFF